MQIKRTGIIYGIMFGVLTVGCTMTTVCQETTLHNFNRVSSLKPVAHTETVQIAATKQTTTAKKLAVHQKKSKMKTTKTATVNSVPLHKKYEHVAVAATAKKISVPKSIAVLATVPQNSQPIIPVENAIWADTKEAAPTPKIENGFSSAAIHLVLAVFAALLGTGSVLGFIFVRSKEKKTQRFDLYNQKYLPIQNMEAAAVLPKKAVVVQELRRKEPAFTSALEIEPTESDERMVRNDYELSRALQELKSKQRIHNVVTAKKNVKSKKNRIGNAKKIGTGVGEFELATRLAKMQGRSTSKVMS